MKPKNEQLQTEQQLKTLKTLKADKEFIAAFRQILAARIAHETPIRHSVFIPWLTRFAAAAACFIMITGAAGLSISYANQTSNPDSFWYKIKIATENLQLTLVENNPLESAALSAKFAQHRLEELTAMEQNDEFALSQENVLKLYYQNIQSLQVALQNINEEPNRRVLNDLLALENQIQTLGQTLETYGARTNITTSTVFEAQSISQFTRNIVQTLSLEYAARLDIAIDDKYGLDRITAFYERINNRYESLSRSWQPKFQEKIARIIPDETLSPEKSQTYLFTQEEMRIVNTLNKAKTELGQIKNMIGQNSPDLNQIMEMAKTLITIDHELAAVEIILK